MIKDDVEINYSNLLNEAKKDKRRRAISPNYEKIRLFLSNPQIKPSEIKINQTPNQKFFNRMASIKKSSAIGSLIKSKISPKSKIKNSTISKKNKEGKKFSVHQLVPILAPRDAVGNEVLEIRNALRNEGYNSEIYVETVHPEMAHESKNYFSLHEKLEPDILIYHLASGSKLVNEILNLHSKIILIYHNLTPEKYFKEINNGVVESIQLARNQIKTLKNHVNLTLTHSEFSTKNLKKEGYSNVRTLPYLINFSSNEVILNNELRNKFKKSVNILFVGRFVPHKKIEDILRIFAYYNTCINSNSNLILVGNFLGAEKYFKWLQYLINNTHLQNVHFFTKLNKKDLVTIYTLTDVYLSMSEHEGFGVPLIESMHFNVPIIAYNTGAISETMGTRGLLTNNKTPEDIGEVIDLIVNNDNLRKKIIQNQCRKLKDFDYNETKKKLIDYIEKIYRDEALN